MMKNVHNNDKDINNENKRNNNNNNTDIVQGNNVIVKTKSRHKQVTKLALTFTTLTLLLLALLSTATILLDSTKQHQQQHQQQQHQNHRNLHHGPKMDYSSYSCDHLNIYLSHNHTKTKQCAYAKTCNDGDGIWAPFLYCSPHYSATTLQWTLFPFLVTWLIILFRMVGSTAEDFFSPSLEMFSLQMGLPPRFAGVTLLALGNGAPDVAATINAIRGDVRLGYIMGLGELTGAGMFISTVITGLITLWSEETTVGRIPCKGALIRDVIMFLMTFILVYMEFTSGVIDRRSIYSMFGLYLAYVGVVLMADVYHRTFVVPRLLKCQEEEEEDDDDDNDNRSEINEEEGMMEEEGDDALNVSLPTLCDKKQHQQDDSANQADETTKLLPNDYYHHHHHPDHFSTLTATTNIIDRQHTKSSRSTGNSRVVTHNPVEYAIEALSNYGTDHTDISSDVGWGVQVENGEETLVVYHPHYGGVRKLPLKSSTRSQQQQQQQQKTASSSFNVSASSVVVPDPHPSSSSLEKSWKKMCRHERNELWVYLQEQIMDDIYLNKENNWVNKLLLTLELPFTLLRMFTIPIPCNGYYCRPLIGLSMILSPFWIVAYTYQQYGIDILRLCDDDDDNNRCSYPYQIYAGLSIPFLLGFVILCFAPPSSTGSIGSTNTTGGTSIPTTTTPSTTTTTTTITPMPLLYSVPIALYGFIIAATWIDCIADQLVSVLTLLGIICHIPGGLMGLTVLAVGNSFGDLAANYAMARKGFANMALTACFAGPVFNMLVGVGLGFFIALSNNATTAGTGHRDAMEVTLTPPLKNAFLFSILNCCLLLVSSVTVGRGFIDKTYGYAALILYAIYTIVSLVV